jgi:hypothetical protein
MPGGTIKMGFRNTFGSAATTYLTCQCGIESKARENNVIIFVQVEKEENKYIFPTFNKPGKYVHPHSHGLTRGQLGEPPQQDPGTLL